MTAACTPRTALRTLLAMVAVMGLVIVMAPPASAVSLKGFSIDAREGATASATYPTGSIPGTASRSTVRSLVSPSNCQKSPNCGHAPLTVNYPEGFDFENQEFFLEITLSFDNSPKEVDTGQRVGGQPIRRTQQGNDLDIYVFVKKPDANDPKVMRDTEIGASQTALQPERVKVFGGFPTYDLVISNFGGVNTGFKIDVAFIPAFITSPSGSDEDFGDENFANTAISSDTDSDSGSDSGGSGSELRELAPRDPATAGPTFADPGVVQLVPTSSDLSALTVGTPPAFGAPDDEFDNALAGNAPSASSLYDQARIAGPPKPVAPALLVFWLGVVPLVLAGAAAVVLIRRRPIALSFDLGAPSTA